MAPTPARLTVDALLDGYLDGIDSDGRLSEKTCFDYRLYADRYIRPTQGAKTDRERASRTCGGLGARWR